MHADGVDIFHRVQSVGQILATCQRARQVRGFS